MNFKNHKNFEFKAAISSFQYLDIRRKLTEMNALNKGEDHQIDTYVVTENGFREKYRQSQIDGNRPIKYARENSPTPKVSNVALGDKSENPNLSLEEFLEGKTILVEVKKKRQIYFVDNVKIHLDTVEELEGQFLEIEAIDTDGSLGEEKIKSQCYHFKDLFGVKDDQIISGSYSDMILAKRRVTK